MKYIFKTLIALLFSITPFTQSYSGNNQSMSPEEAKQFVKTAVIYALENNDPNMDYSKYVSKDFKNPIDDETFNFEQWVQHQKHIKEKIISMKPRFDLMVAEGDHVAAIFYIHLIKKDGSELDVKDMAFFKIKNHKIVYVEELTHLVKGAESDRNIGSTK